MPDNDLVEFLKRETNELAQEYERIQTRVRDDPGTAGDQGEENWATILRQWLPAYYPVVTKGRILGRDGTASPQVDVLVLSPAYPQKLRDKKLYLAGGVVAAFECKITLRGGHLRRVFETCRKLRAISPAAQGKPSLELRPRIIFGLLAHSHEWTGPTEMPAHTIARLISELNDELVKSPLDMPDVFCVADVGFWHAMKCLMPASKTIGATGVDPLTAPELITSYIAHYQGAGATADKFTSVGAFLTILFGKLAWNDPAMRGLEEYFLTTGVSGSGGGTVRTWPLDVLSSDARSGIARKRLRVDMRYDEWSNGPF